KEVCYAKDRNAAVWATRYQFNSTNIGQFPLPPDKLVTGRRGAALDALSRELAAVGPEAVVTGWRVAGTGGLAQRLDAAKARWVALYSSLGFAQEERDWETYRLYGLLDEDLTYHGDAIDQIRLGQRAFEVALARKVTADEEETAWFDRHGSTLIT